MAMVPLVFQKVSKYKNDIKSYFVHVTEEN